MNTLCAVVWLAIGAMLLGLALPSLFGRPTQEPPGVRPSIAGTFATARTPLRHDALASATPPLMLAATPAFGPALAEGTAEPGATAINGAGVAGAIPPATASPAINSTPAPAMGASPAASRSLFAMLASVPFPAHDLPAGYAAASIQAGLPSSVDLFAEMAGYARSDAITVTLVSSGSTDHIIYLSFPDARTAATAFAMQRASAAAINPVTFTPVGFAMPVRCVSFGSPVTSTGQHGTSACTVLLDSVEVVSITQRVAAGRELQYGDNDRAIDLARAGVAHLLNVGAGQ